MTLSLTHFLVLSVIILGVGVITIIRKRHAIGIFMGVELILAAANLNLVAFNHYSGPALGGQMLALFVTLIAVAQATVALALFWNLHCSKSTVDIEAIPGLQRVPEQEH